MKSNHQRAIRNNGTTSAKTQIQREPVAERIPLDSEIECSSHPSAIFKGVEQAAARAKSRDPKEKCSPEELEKYMQMRERKLKSHLSLPGFRMGPGELSDAQALDLISLVVADNASRLRRLAIECLDLSDELNVFWCAYLEQAVTAAETAARRARWYGLRAAPSLEAELGGEVREPLFLDLSGFEGVFDYNDKSLLYHIGSALYAWRDEIQYEIQTTLCGRKEVEMAEAMVIAEFSEERAGALEEVEAIHENGERTEKEKWAMRLKAAVTVNS